MLCSLTWSSRLLVLCFEAIQDRTFSKAMRLLRCCCNQCAAAVTCSQKQMISGL